MEITVAQHDPASGLPHASVASWRRRIRWSRLGTASLASHARRHGVFLALLAAGALVRAIAQLAYLPALLRFDSVAYLETSVHLQPHLGHPAGYPIFLKLLRGLTADASLQFIPLVQHMLGLGVATVLYVVQLRLGVNRALAAVSVAPLLLDAYWINLEQGVTSEAVFVALIALACAAVLWRQPLVPVAAALAGFALAGAAITRTVAILLILPFAVAVVALAARGSRRRPLLVFLLVAALPLGAYAAWFNHAHGRYALAGFSARYFYGRVATFVDCTRLSVPRQEMRLCPNTPVSERQQPDYYTWNPASPYYRFGRSTRNVLARRFSKHVIAQQPIAYVRTIAGDVIRGFSITRSDRPGERPISRWQFHPRHPVFVNGVLCGEHAPGTVAARRCPPKLAKLRLVAQRFGDSDVTVNSTLARWLTDYRRVAFVPGPLLAGAILIGAVGVIAARRRRTTNLQTACFLMTAIPTILILGPIATTHFSWRYQIVGFVLAGPAASLGLTAIFPGRGRRSEAPLIATSVTRREAQYAPHQAKRGSRHGPERA